MTNLLQAKWLVLVVAVLLLSGTASQEKAKVPLPTHSDVKYGPHPTKNVLDFWQAPAKKPTPLLVSIHHGGFSQGQKFVRADLLKDSLAAGISVAAINYRLTEQAPALGGPPVGPQEARRASEGSSPLAGASGFQGPTGGELVKWTSSD